MHASAKHGGGETAGRCGHDEGPAAVHDVCRETSRDERRNPPLFEYVAILYIRLLDCQSSSTFVLI